MDNGNYFLMMVLQKLNANHFYFWSNKMEVLLSWLQLWPFGADSHVDSTVRQAEEKRKYLELALILL